MNVYDQTAIKEIHLWKNPEQNFLEKCLSIATRPIDAAGDLIMDAPYVKEAIEKATKGLVTTLNDAALSTVSVDAIFRDFCERKVTSLDDIAKLELCEIDRSVGFLAAKYKGLALTEGALAGSGSFGTPVLAAAAIAVDIPVIIGLCLRAIGEYATYYGFDITTQQERLNAFSILSLATSPKDGAKQLVLANIVRIAQQAAAKKTWKELNKHAFVVIIQQIAKQLGIRVTKAKLAQIIPGIGIAVGAGYNAYLMSEVCEAAFMIYRERHLARFYDDPNIIEVTVEPADEISFADK